MSSSSTTKNKIIIEVDPETLPEGFSFSISTGVKPQQVNPIAANAQSTQPAIAAVPVPSGEPPRRAIALPKLPQVDFSKFQLWVLSTVNDKGNQFWFIFAVIVAVGFYNGDKILELIGSVPPSTPIPAQSNQPPEQSTNPPPTTQSNPPTTGNLPPVPVVPFVAGSAPLDSKAGEKLPEITVKPQGESKRRGVLSKLKSALSGNNSEVTKSETYFPLANANVNQNLRISSRVGAIRPLGCTKNCRRHQGNDYVTADGTQMKAIAVADGHITRREEFPEFTLGFLHVNSPVGGVVSITSEINGKLYIFRYVHLDGPALSGFKPGQRVTAGQFLDTITITFPGSSAAHLHLEVYWQDEDGKWHLHKDPQALLESFNPGMLELNR